MKLQIPPSWKEYLKPELKQDYMLNLMDFLDEELDAGKKIFPQTKDILAALKATEFKKIKVVILGQDPYHNIDQAHGLSFSVKKGVKVPPSLANIYKELEEDLKITKASHGNLQHWADQGVFLLNNVLTVEAHQPNSHKKKGWEQFTDKIVQIINEELDNVVFLLWGAPAQKKAKNVDDKKHYILTSPHPSPLSSYRGFFGCKHFSKTNDYLKSCGIKQIDWSIPD